MARFKLFNRSWELIFLFLLVSDSCFACSYTAEERSFTLRQGATFNLRYLYPEGLTFSISRGGKVIQKLTSSDNLSANIKLTDFTGGATFTGNGHEVQFSVVQNTAAYSEIRVVRNLVRGQSSRDCLNFEDGVQWFAGPQQKFQQYWPINGQRYTEYSYVTKEADSNAIAERYWLSSTGIFIYVEPNTPLFISQSGNSLCFSANRKTPYNTEIQPFTFAYRIGVATNPQLAHKQAIRRFLGKPTGVPDLEMTKKPIWSTWAKYKRDIDTTVVEKFAQEIVTNFGDYRGQFEIDDKWETCYGSLTVDRNRFDNLKTLVEKLRSSDTTGYGFDRVTMWIHPFINKDCGSLYTTALRNAYLVVNSTGQAETIWWNSGKDEAAYIDFTNPEAANWFLDRLITLQKNTGLNSFKFDAGESSWAPPNPLLYGQRDLNPNILSTKYIDTVTNQYIKKATADSGLTTVFKNLIEVRSGFMNQDIPVFMRMIDKDTYFDYTNGLPTLVTTLLQLNLAGYPFVLPDMVGGNGYNEVTVIMRL